ncbi:MAG TPA: P-loop NTPase fold protein, partial [Myxococcota bacterium]|nr:P-loop NTPase fold protein [Myxococcota bacterium]
MNALARAQMSLSFPRDPTGQVVLGGAPPDQPYPIEDSLGRELTVAQLHNLVSRVPTPSAVGLFGPWGSGKSTLLHLLAKRLREEPIGEVIELDPWMYESEGSPLRALVWKIQALARARTPEAERQVPWEPLRTLA